jgi:hypothetical protein
MYSGVGWVFINMMKQASARIFSPGRFAQASENSPILKIFTLFRFIPNPESSSFYTCRLAQSD